MTRISPAQIDDPGLTNAGRRVVGRFGITVEGERGIRDLDK